MTALDWVDRKGLSEWETLELNLNYNSNGQL